MLEIPSCLIKLKYMKIPSRNKRHRSKPSSMKHLLTNRICHSEVTAAIGTKDTLREIGESKSLQRYNLAGEEFGVRVAH